jgi:hypothetical protein
MTTMLIDSEHDMEVAIGYTTDLVQRLPGAKVINFSFPSERLSKIFLKNLAWTFHKKKLSPLTGLQINVFIPEDPPSDMDEESGAF